MTLPQTDEAGGDDDGAGGGGQLPPSSSSSMSSLQRQPASESSSAAAAASDAAEDDCDDRSSSPAAAEEPSVPVATPVSMSDAALVPPTVGNSGGMKPAGDDAGEEEEERIYAGEAIVIDDSSVLDDVPPTSPDVESRNTDPRARASIETTATSASSVVNARRRGKLVVLVASVAEEDATAAAAAGISPASAIAVPSPPRGAGDGGISGVNGPVLAEAEAVLEVAFVSEEAVGSSAVNGIGHMQASTPPRQQQVIGAGNDAGVTRVVALSSPPQQYPGSHTAYATLPVARFAPEAMVACASPVMLEAEEVDVHEAPTRRRCRRRIIAGVVLAVVVAIGVTAVVLVAWGASRSSASGTSTLGGAPPGEDPASALPDPTLSVCRLDGGDDVACEPLRKSDPNVVNNVSGVVLCHDLRNDLTPSDWESVTNEATGVAENIAVDSPETEGLFPEAEFKAAEEEETECTVWVRDYSRSYDWPADKCCSGCWICPPGCDRKVSFDCADVVDGLVGDCGCDTSTGLRPPEQPLPTVAPTEDSSFVSSQSEESGVPAPTSSSGSSSADDEDDHASLAPEEEKNGGIAGVDDGGAPASVRTSEEGASTFGTGVIIGLVVGVLAGVVLAAVLWISCMRRKKRRRTGRMAGSSGNEEEGGETTRNVRTRSVPPIAGAGALGVKDSDNTSSAFTARSSSTTGGSGATLAPPDGPETRSLSSKGRRTRTEVFTVVVPRSVRPGQDFRVSAGERMLTVQCPSDSGPGKSLRLTVEAEEGAAAMPQHEGGEGAFREEETEQEEQRQLDWQDEPERTTLFDQIQDTGVLGMNMESRSFRYRSLPLPSSQQPSRSARSVSGNPLARTVYTRQMESSSFMNEEEAANESVRSAPQGEHRQVPATCPPRQMYEVVVPSGITPGQPFPAMADDRKVMITCPSNASEGKKVLFTLSSQVGRAPDITRTWSDEVKRRISSDGGEALLQRAVESAVREAMRQSLGVPQETGSAAGLAVP